MLNVNLKCQISSNVSSNVENHVDKANNSAWTPLIGATYNGHLESVNVLLKYNAKVHLKDNYGKYKIKDFI